MFFNETVKNDKTGYYVMSLSFAEDSVLSGNSRQWAYNRWIILEKRLSRDKNIYRQFVKFMDEYNTLGHRKRWMNRTFLTSLNDLLHIGPNVQSDLFSFYYVVDLSVT